MAAVTAAVEFEKFIRSIPKEEFARLMNEYMAESNHNGWDGYDRRDMAPLGRLFADIMLYHKSRDQDSPDHFAKEWHNGVDSF